MRTLVPGHVYELNELGLPGRSGSTQTLRFIRRSGGAIEYGEEWPGLQTQEVLRALIDRTEYLYEVLPCVETGDAAYHLRMALYQYELRAYRRKQEGLNRLQPAHDDTERPRPWREFPDGVPFTEQGIERRPVGADGHITLEPESESEA